jgi:aquaporin Z
MNEAAPYIVAQVLWAGFAHFVATFGMNMDISVTVSPHLLPVFIAEWIFTFALVTAVLQTAVSKSSSGNNYFGFAIGAVVIAGASAVWGISGWFFNPAVLFGVGYFGGLSWATIATILTAQVIASLCASLFFSFTEKTK